MNEWIWRILNAFNFMAFAGIFLVSFLLGGCSSEVDLASGGAMPMKCHWTFLATMFVSLIGMTLAVCSTYIHTKPSRMSCTIGIIATIIVISLLIADFGIGICAHDGADCHTTRFDVVICLLVSLFASAISLIKCRFMYEGLEVPEKSFQWQFVKRLK